MEKGITNYQIRLVMVWNLHVSEYMLGIKHGYIWITLILFFYAAYLHIVFLRVVDARDY
jgi:hypothetical protein